MVGTEGGEVESGWDWRPLRGGWGRGRDPTPEGGNWGNTVRAEDQKGAWTGIPCPLGPREPAEILSLIPCPPRPPPATQVLKEWEGGKGKQK